jgi:hypothetical protein
MLSVAIIDLLAIITVIVLLCINKKEKKIKFSVQAGNLLIFIYPLPRTSKANNIVAKVNGIECPTTTFDATEKFAMSFVKNHPDYARYAEITERAKGYKPMKSIFFGGINGALK